MKCSTYKLHTKSHLSFHTNVRTNYMKINNFKANLEKYNYTTVKQKDDEMFFDT
jgi:aspartyl aminopeptidase